MSESSSAQRGFPSKKVPYLAQTTAGGCGACSFIMVAQYFDPALKLTEVDVLERFGVDGFGPRCFALAPSFFYAAKSVGLTARVQSMTKVELESQLTSGPVILYHMASEASDALPHFSVATSFSLREISRQDPGFGADVVDMWDRFERLWTAAKVSWWPYDGCYAAVLRPPSSWSVTESSFEP